MRWRIRKSGNPRSQFSGIVFTLRGKTGFFADKNVFKGVLNLDLVNFCHNMIDSVDDWFAQKRAEPNVARDLPKLAQHGFQNFVVGVDIPTIGGTI